jgi:hypothetical protein
MVNSEELIGTAESLTLYTRSGINLCRYKRVRLYLLILHVLYLQQDVLQTSGVNFLCITTTITPITLHDSSPNYS